MEATLKFDLPEETNEHQLAVHAGDLASIIYELDQYLRGKVKYESDTYTEKEVDRYQEIRDKLWELFNDSGLSHDLIF